MLIEVRSRFKSVRRKTIENETKRKTKHEMGDETRADLRKMEQDLWISQHRRVWRRIVSEANPSGVSSGHRNKKGREQRTKTDRRSDM
ncbi:hypothetical protein J6590_003650 [Homalodisca vitripennis]|nr:hypothetical protein J6590_003650 [Homalodisca vitripennis]